MMLTGQSKCRRQVRKGKMPPGLQKGQARSAYNTPES